MDEQRLTRQTRKVVQEIVKLAASYPSIGKKEFETILSRIIEHVAEDTDAGPDQVAMKTNQVLQDLPQEYGSLSADSRSWEALAAYLYAKYLKELGVI
jgi:hypothetical protein